MDLQSLLASIPYLKSHNLRVDVAADGSVEARMPYQKALTNHVGILHAAAIYAVAETAAGVAASVVVPGGAAIVLLRGGKVNYKRMAEGDLTASACAGADVAERARADFESDARADAVVEVNVVNSEGQTVFEGTFDYALRPPTS